MKNVAYHYFSILTSRGRYKDDVISREYLHLYKVPLRFLAVRPSEILALLAMLVMHFCLIKVLTKTLI
jgi:hypothetical protein